MDNEPKVIIDRDGTIIDATWNGMELTVGSDSEGEWVMLDDLIFRMDEWVEMLNNLNEMIVMLRKEQ